MENKNQLESGLQDEEPTKEELQRKKERRKNAISEMDTEFTDKELEVEGEIPGWLEGSLLRNGPAMFESKERKLSHWFDGMSMLHSFRIEDGEVYFTNKYLRTDVYKKFNE